ncbi:uncharacterized protein LOC132601754 [Lycium barbarum]|uniref:uncharacterized protein LOC132601754 n=1 Tax=Lycium barbarum TaxID=112863 RepID=UPI00293F2EB2|nr:uncharacterized protein LOC132601754 [Lycium barbarum]
MRVVTWNVRGLNNGQKQNDLKKFIVDNKVDIIAVLEHRVAQQKATPIIKKVARGWESVYYYSPNRKGRIWLMWDPRYCEFSVLQMKEQYVHGQVRIYATNKNFLLTAVYGLHTIVDRKPLWDDLLTLAQQITIPWLIMGDFNAVLEIEDRLVGSPVQANEMVDFSNFVQSASMLDLKVVGREYTWTNNHVFSRIDRGLVNASWVQMWDALEIIVMAPEFSDHSPLSLTVEERQTMRAKPFKFFNCLATHPDFRSSVQRNCQQICNGRPMEKVWKKMHRLKHVLKKLNNTEFKGVDERIALTKQKLQDIQAQMIGPNDHQLYFEEQQRVKIELEKWYQIQESAMKQKARVNWLKLGDSNTTYFHACLRNRMAQNHIRSLTTNDGRLIQTDAQVQEEVVGFYKQSLGTAASHLPIVRTEVMQQGRVLSRDQQLILVENVTIPEIVEAVMDIEDNKAPGSDGYNAFFYKKIGTLLERM